MTEKNYNPEQKNMKAIKQQEAVQKIKDVAPETKIEDKKEEKVEEAKKTIKKKEIPKIKKTEAVVNARDLPISMKHSKDFCRFIKNKKIEKAISDLEEVIAHKKAVPSKQEKSHKTGMAAGIYADNTAKAFLMLVKSLQANANAGNLENPIIVEGIANMASRPFGKFGRVRKKRAHVRIVAKEKSIVNKLNKKERRK